ncbi:MAG: LacI family DNA-binding transcriptional regulator [Janthinobacterium lividum]
MKERATRADVASKAGVSKTTVTYVLGDRYDIAIPEPTRERVRIAAHQLGYRPHAAARALASGRTESITVAFPERIGAHYAHVLQAFERHTNAHGYHMIASTIGHLNIENVLPDLWALLSNLTDGVILVDMPGSFKPYIDEILPNAKPIVSMGVFTMPSMDSVEVCLEHAADAALAHLLNSGASRLAFFGPGSAEGTSSSVNTAYAGDPRPAAYQKAMQQAGLRPEMIEGDPASRLANRESLLAYAARYGCPDALFCFNDEIAISACRALRELGLRVPDDVLVVGCDGSEESEYAFPSLSTIAQPLDQMCDLAWTFMTRRLAEPSLPRQHAAVDAEFLVRGSSRR